MFDVAVLGAGAAGMMCAAVAGQRGLRVVLVDHAERLAEKSASPAVAAATSPTSGPGPPIFCPKTRISAARHCRLTRRRIFWR